MQVIPCRANLTHYTIQVTLDGATYTLEFRYSGREDCYYLSVMTEDDSPLMMGCKVVANYPLANRITDPRKWPGALFALDTSGAHKDPAYQDLGDRVQLIYYTADELPIFVLSDTGEVVTASGEIIFEPGPGFEF